MKIIVEPTCFLCYNENTKPFLRNGEIQMAQNYDAVLFDFDGTLADTGVGIFNSIRIAIAAMGFKPISEKRLRTFIGPPIFDSFKRELGMSDEQCKAAVKRYREVYGKRGIYHFEVYPGIEELLRDLKKSGIKVAIASSKPEKFIRKILAFLKWNELIDCICAPNSDDAPEDKSVLITKAVNEFGIKKSRVLMVGDRHFDINGAKIAGVHSAGVTFGYGSAEELKDAGATYIAGSADELRKIIFS